MYGPAVIILCFLWAITANRLEQRRGKLIKPPGQGLLSCLFAGGVLALPGRENAIFHSHPVRNAVVFCICVSLRPFPLSAKGIHISSGFKSCREDFGTELSHNPHPAGNHT